MAEKPENPRKFKWVQEVAQDGSIKYRPNYEVYTFKPPPSEIIEARVRSSLDSATATSASFSTSASFATSASYAFNATSASYAISASVEIIKEVSSSYADTASLASTANTASYVLASNVDQPFTDLTASSAEITNEIKSGIFLNKQILTINQTVPSTYNGMLTSPLSVSESVNLTIETDSTLVIL